MPADLLPELLVHCLSLLLRAVDFSKTRYEVRTYVFDQDPGTGKHPHLLTSHPLT